MTTPAPRITQQDQILEEQADLIAVIEQHLTENGSHGRAMSIREFSEISGIHQVNRPGFPRHS